MRQSQRQQRGWCHQGGPSRDCGEVDASTDSGRTGNTGPIEIRTGKAGRDAGGVLDTTGAGAGRDQDAGGSDQTVTDGMVQTTGAGSGTGVWNDVRHCRDPWTAGRIPASSGHRYYRCCRSKSGWVSTSQGTATEASLSLLPVQPATVATSAGGSDAGSVSQEEIQISTGSWSKRGRSEVSDSGPVRRSRSRSYFRTTGHRDCGIRAGHPAATGHPSF